MKKHYLSTFFGAAICGGIAFGIWPELWKSYGIIGGWAAAVLIIGIMWYMNHHNGVIYNPNGKIWLDQGWCIGAAGLAWGTVRYQGELSGILQSLPTVLCCLIGGTLAALAVKAIRSNENKGKEESK